MLITSTMIKTQLKKEVKRLMALEGDYAAWYYNPTQAKYSRIWREERHEDKEKKGTF